MLANRRVGTMIPVHDLKRATDWYRDRLGLEPKSRYHDMGASYVLGEGTEFFLYQTPNAGQAPHTLMSFYTDTIEEDMKRMREAGVEFIDYPELSTVDGLMDTGEVKNAWFKDSEGNILGIVEGS
ncbi:VOC family protein [Arsenicitalea aurantiaca]|uniref:VOC family protein n=1 Tax=Arsenicitalea aurantiaca TaxID=1783274 RepID=A0A433XFE5_9HYPH|nr:VOC family protein [Arsenicitalea aurantiaca]RUT32776.1 VOC family protein [Arsenicitalea aurantiaca]